MKGGSTLLIIACMWWALTMDEELWANNQIQLFEASGELDHQMKYDKILRFNFLFFLSYYEFLVVYLL